MAKISARGDEERMRWGHRGDYLVLTVQGRLLRKTHADTTYRVIRPRGQKRWTPTSAGAQAAIYGLSFRG